ncbi:hypothetical protein IHQ71_30755 (plasmid) [Rhizobium sp. TH2]|uniref:hypothetical protein n=1 Tax=Rhizobium sp. TH2 TaxID=2775403 RepID=UPI0021584890|nr:hypothetical protein [Rhizobium sp. TH2]UVC12387.1 hypothetical protein IHQ71_30755 [Rhizobium sp. TH2]
MAQGHTHEQPIELRLALRFARVGYYLAAIVGAVFTPIGYFTFQSPDFAIVSMFFALCYLVCAIIATTKVAAWARLLMCIVGGAHYATTLFFVGPYAGLQAFVAVLMAMPMVMFARSELRLIVPAYALQLSCIIAGDVLVHR